MKGKFFKLTIMFLAIFVFGGTASAQWTAVIHAEGQQNEGQYKSNVIIGVEAEEKQIPAPPLAPNFSCNMNLFQVYDWSKKLAQDIRKDCSNGACSWILAINPHGNEGSFEDAVSKISWDPSQLGDGLFEIREGWDGSGEVVVQDIFFTLDR